MSLWEDDGSLCSFLAMFSVKSGSNRGSSIHFCDLIQDVFGLCVLLFEVMITWGFVDVVFDNKQADKQRGANKNNANNSPTCGEEEESRCENLRYRPGNIECGR